MVIQGTIEELKAVFRYASETRCVLLYFHVDGDVFLLYHGGHYVYLKTACLVGQNVALPPIAYMNLARFIQAEEHRAARDERTIDLIRIEKDQIVTSASVRVSHQYKVPMMKDGLFSPTAERLKELVTFEDTSAPSIRIQKRVFMQYLNKGKAHSKSVTLIYQQGGNLTFERVMWSGEVRSCTVYEKGFVPLKGSRNTVFVIHDDALQLLRSIRFIKPDDYIYLKRTDEYVQMEHEGMPGRFRFFMPINSQPEIENAL